MTPLPELKNSTDPRVQGGTVVNHDQQFKADVLIEDGKIFLVSPGLEVGPYVPPDLCTCLLL